MTNFFDRKIPIEYSVQNTSSDKLSVVAYEQTGDTVEFISVVKKALENSINMIKDTRKDTHASFPRLFN